MPTPIPPTSKETLDEHIAALQAAKSDFAALSIDARIELIESAIAGTLAVAPEWVEAACAAKGIARGTHTESEEWLGGPVLIVRNLRLLKKSLQEIREHGRPQLDADAITTTCSGQTAVRVYPASGLDKLLFMDFTGEIWMEPGVTPNNLAETMATVYQAGASTDGAVSLVLGAGNVASIGPMDVIHKFFVENEVCILKMNPVNEYLGPFIERSFKPYIDRNFLKVVYGGADVGDYLCKHADIENIHITGSDKTHDIIVWGPPGPERDARMEKNEPLNTKPISSELGNVSPVIVVPGPWSESDLQFQATNISSMVTNNGSFNCNAAKLVIQHNGWNQRAALMDAVEQSLATAGPRRSYYPGAHQRYDTFLNAHSDAKPLAERNENCVPWTVIRDVDSSKKDDICFTTEAFCGVLSETTLGGANPVEFLANAVEFCNNDVWGTLSACILVHPKSLKDPAMAKAFEQAVADLKYGTVGVNHWPALSYAWGVTTWGAYPGHSLADIQSGRGVVHNTLMFDKPQKTVVRGPFRVFPKPPWFNTHSNSHNVAIKMLKFESAPSYLKLPSIVGSAICG